MPAPRLLLAGSFGKGPIRALMLAKIGDCIWQESVTNEVRSLVRRKLKIRQEKGGEKQIGH